MEDQPQGITYILADASGMEAWRFTPPSLWNCIFRERRRLNADDALKSIEDAVYDHPETIDDARVVFFSDFDRTFVLPAADAELAGDAAEVLYPLSGMETVVSECADVLLASLLPKGLKSFIGRTFPGLQPIHPALPLLAYFRKSPEGGRRLYVCVRGERVDIAAFDSARLLWFCTQEAIESSDAAYHALNIWNMLGFNPESDSMIISGPREIKDDLLQLMRRHIGYVTALRIPRYATSGAPVCMLLHAAANTPGNPETSTHN